jgi:histidyl-tRNA synthetase
MQVIEALRAGGVSVVHARTPARTAWGSMKSQFKKADASGARHALIFGADELAAARSPSSRCATPPPPSTHHAAGRRRRLGAELLNA